MVITKPIKLKPYSMLLLLLTLGLVYPIELKAQTEMAINLDQAVQMAIDHDYQAKIAQNSLEKAKLVVKEKVIGSLPKIQVGAEKGENLSSNADLQNTSLTVTETIPTNFQFYGKKTASELEISKWGQQTSEAEYRISRADLIYNTVSLYLNTVKAKQLLEYQEMAVANAQANADYAKTQLSLGKVTKVTQLTAENDLAKARYELENSRQGYLVKLKQLAREIGVNDYLSLRLDQTAAQPIIDVTDYERLKAKALAERLELVKTQIAVKEAEQELAKAFNEGLPTLSLAYQNRSREESYNLEYDFLNGDLNWAAAWQQDYLDDITYGGNDDVFGTSKRQYKLKLSWSLSMGGAKNKTQQAAYTLENAKLAYLQSIEDILIAVDEAVSAYELALLKATQAEQEIALYQKDLELTKLKFELGSVTPLQVKEAELKLTNARLENENTNYDLQIAAVKLRLELGELYDYPSK